LTLDETVTGFKHEERVSRRQAAERLADIAYALTAGETLELRADGERLRVRVADDVVLRRRDRATGDHVSVEVELSWLA
jgi:amphi-Trp domain-containing protein